MPTSTMDPAVTERPTAKQKKPYVKRLIPDGTQRARQIVQLFFLALSTWIGIQFYFFVRQFELAEYDGVTRPPGVEGWLPIAGMMNGEACEVYRSSDDAKARAPRSTGVRALFRAEE